MNFITKFLKILLINVIIGIDLIINILLLFLLVICNFFILNKYSIFILKFYYIYYIYSIFNLNFYNTSM